MSEFNFAKAWAPYESLLATDKLAALIETPLSFSGEPLIGLVPSILWAGDGTRIETIYLVMDEVYCQLVPGSSFAFRSRRDGFQQIRWFLRQEKVTIDGRNVMLESALCELAQHGERHTLSYVGSARETWVTAVREAFPAWLVKF